MLNIKNTTDGYLKDVEIKGNTVQDAENLADIRSVGDKVEGQELYKIDVVSTNGLDKLDSDYQEDKLTILSPVQLEKVGDVADRIICKDGVWGVEKNIDLFRFEESTNLIKIHIQKENVYRFSLQGVISSPSTNLITTFGEVGVYSKDVEGVAIDKNAGNVFIQISYANLGVSVDNLTTQQLLNGAISFIKRKDVKMLYIKSTPQFIPLPHDQQVKLKTFANKTNITSLTEIEPTIKAQVPKSIGATVNTHTEQIGNLSKELDRVKKLEESTVSTVTTESGFTTVEETSNGYFEDVKLEGKTLVNLIEDVPFGYSATYPSRNFNNWKMLKPSTQYTFALLGDFTNAKNILISNSSVTEVILPKNSYGQVFTFTTPSNLNEFTSLQRIYVYKESIDLTESQVAGWKLIILEGDHTQNPPSYFEGLMSAGQDVEEVSVASDNNGCFDLTSMMKPGNINSSTGEPNTDYAAIYSVEFIGVIPNRTYKAINNLYTNCRFFYYTKNKEYIGCSNTNTSDIVVPNGCYFIRVRFVGTDVTSTTIVKAIDSVDREYKSNKKQLLYYNPTTQTWEKPILRQWDSIEKHSDGKYYYHKRSGEVVLNGSENWTLYSNGDASTNYIGFRLTKGDVTGIQLQTGIRGISDKFNYIESYTELNQGLKEGLYCGYNAIVVGVNKSKLSTQDVEGFKAWLQANPTTVVYQLAQEEIYECTSIDLITYENETNYIVSSGAITPKSTLKVHNNISNVVKILQEKVSLLESNVKASQEVQDMMILETDMRILDMELALMEHMPITLNLGENTMLRSATYFNFLKNHIVNETYSKEYLENVMNKYLATNRLTQEEYDELYKMLYPPKYDIELPIEE